MKIKKFMTFLIMFCLSVTFSASINGGNGQIISGTPHLLNLYVYYNYDETDLQIMRNAFQEASELLYNATNGQVQIGVVRVSKKSTFNNRADVWVLEGESGAYAHVGGLGTPGLRITIFRDQHRWTNNDGPDNNERGQFGIIHESGHYVFELYDEYRGGTVNARCLEDENSTVACIMDGGTTSNNMRTEFCSQDGLNLITDHFPNNDQEDIWGESCWEHIVTYVLSEYGITMTAPSVANPPNTAMPAGHQDISWVVVGDQLRYSLCIDKSYSMVGSKLDLTKVAADLFVDLVHEGESEFLGVTSFSNSAYTEFPITEVTGVSIKTNAKNTIDNIAVENMTAMGDGMRLSLKQITGDGTVPRDDSNIEVIILLSDGKHNFGAERPDEVIPDIKDRGVRVFTIGLGDPDAAIYPLDEETLQEIADLTGGLYRRAPDETELQAIYTEYAAEIRGDAVSSEETDWMTSREPGETKEKEAFIDSFTKEATFVLHWSAGHDYFDLKLRKPDGSIIDSTVASSDPKIIYWEQPFYEYYRIKEPETGNWKLLVSIAEDTRQVREETIAVGAIAVGAIEFSIAPPRPRFTIQVLSSSPSVDFVVHTPDFRYSYPQVPILQASVLANVPVAGALVEGIVTGPQGFTRQIKLYDDGQFSHGDHRANDGIYSNRFLHFPKNGGYDFRLLVENKNGVEAQPDEVMPPDWKPKSIAPFTRISQNHITIQSVPETLLKPEIKDISPNKGRYGKLLDIIIQGKNFVEGASVIFSRSDIFLKRIIYVSDNELKVRLQISSGAVSGYSDITVINPGGIEDTARDVFQIVGPLYPLGLSIHYGYARPLGNFDIFYDSGMSIAADLEYRLTKSLSVELLAGYHTFKSDTLDNTYWINLSLNLNYCFPTLPKWVFVNIAPGIYFPKSGSSEFGLMKGGGLYWPITASVLAQVAYNHHTIFTKGDDTTFSTIWLGIKYRF